MAVKSLSAWKPGFGVGFNDFFEPWNDWFNDKTLSRTATVPKVNITEDKDKYNLTLAAPGLTKQDFKVSLDDNVLTISAEKEESKEDKDKDYTRKEYNYSSFSRSFTLPGEVVQEKIEASYENGILKLTLPKDGKGTDKNQKAIPIK